MVYRLSAHFPDSEKFGLTAQMRRAAVSVPSNLAEGQAGQGRKEFVHFSSNAEGSFAELDTHLLLCLELVFFSAEQVQAPQSLVTELQKVITALPGKVSRLGSSHYPLTTSHSLVKVPQ